MARRGAGVSEVDPFRFANEPSESRISPGWGLMTKRLLETLSGVGAIHTGELLLRRTAYEVKVWSDETPPASGEDPKTVARIEGHIDIRGIAEAVVLAGPGTLTLTLEDGRRLAFQLTGSGGGIVGRGWLP